MLHALLLLYATGALAATPYSEPSGIYVQCLIPAALAGTYGEVQEVDEAAVWLSVSTTGIAVGRMNIGGQ